MKGRAISAGRASGTALVSSEPISFYGGVDPATGIVIERGHQLEGQCIGGRVLVFPSGRGSTVGSYVIYALARSGTAPVAMINQETETIVATGAILAGIPCVDRIDITALRTGEILEVDAGEGTVKRG